jgi:hypothetical protein
MLVVIPWRTVTATGHADPMRYERCVTSMSWIPSEAVTGLPRLAFDRGLAHYDDPPPAELGPMENLFEVLERLRAADQFRFANVLRAWIDVDDSGQVTGRGYSGRGLIGATTVNLPWRPHRFQAVQLREIKHEPEHGPWGVRFMQTTGGQTGAPMPRRVRDGPYFRWQAPTVWTTLSLTLCTDGQAEFGMIGASRFPRHWVYGPDGLLVRKSGLTSWEDWYRESGLVHTPWGEADSSALVVAVETALERSLSRDLMHGGAKPRIARLPAGTTLVQQGQPETDVYLVLDGVIGVERDGERLAEYGPGALLGERAHLDEGTRTSTLVAVTPCRVAAVGASQLNRSALEQLSGGHRREDPGPD